MSQVRPSNREVGTISGRAHHPMRPMRIILRTSLALALLPGVGIMTIATTKEAAGQEQHGSQAGTVVAGGGLVLPPSIRQQFV